MAKHHIAVDDHELAVLNYVLSTYETVITNVKYGKRWKKTEAIQDLENLKRTVSSARQTLIFKDKD